LAKKGVTHKRVLVVMDHGSDNSRKHLHPVLMRVERISYAAFDE
jgi:hypothetical protein